jgi:predicted dehydrogenase
MLREQVLIIGCIADEEVPTTDGRVGRAGIELAEAVYRSQEQGKQVSLPL